MHFSAVSGTGHYLPSRNEIHRLASRGEARIRAALGHGGSEALSFRGVAYSPTGRKPMKRRSQLLSCPAVLLGVAVRMPATAAPLPTCALLGTNPAYGLAGNPQISNLTATLYAAGADLVPNPFGGPPSSNAKPY